jgi:hypothetical protein
MSVRFGRGIAGLPGQLSKRRHPRRGCGRWLAAKRTLRQNRLSLLARPRPVLLILLVRDADGGSLADDEPVAGGHVLVVG